MSMTSSGFQLWLEQISHIHQMHYILKLVRINIALHVADFKWTSEQNLASLLLIYARALKSLWTCMDFKLFFLHQNNLIYLFHSLQTVWNTSYWNIFSSFTANGIWTVRKMNTNKQYQQLFEWEMVLQISLPSFPLLWPDCSPVTWALPGSST